jgi:hypothetical protein
VNRSDLTQLAHHVGRPHAMPRELPVHGDGTPDFVRFGRALQAAANMVELAGNPDGKDRE